MKFLCDRCKTRYAIADERVRGKILKIRCKNCSAVITVREGMDESAEATASAPPPVPDAAQAGAEAPPPPALEEEWYVSRDGQQEGPFTLTEAQAWIAARGPDDELFCWNEGFDDWLPVEKVSHFRGLRGAAPRTRAATRPGIPREPEPQPLFAATLAAIEAEAAAAASADKTPPPSVIPAAKNPAPSQWRSATPATGVPPIPESRTPPTGLPSLRGTPATGTPAVRAPTQQPATTPGRPITPSAGSPAVRPATPSTGTPAAAAPPSLPKLDPAGPQPPPRPSLPSPFGLSPSVQKPNPFTTRPTEPGAPLAPATDPEPDSAGPAMNLATAAATNGAMAASAASFAAAAPPVVEPPAASPPEPTPVPAPPPVPAPRAEGFPPTAAPTPPITAAAAWGGAPLPRPAPAPAAAPAIPAASAAPRSPAARFDTGDEGGAPADDVAPPAPEAAAAPASAGFGGDDLDIGEVSRVVRLADLGKPRAQPQPRPRQATASFAVVGRATGAVPTLPAPGADLVSPLELGAMSPPPVVARRGHRALYAGLALAAVAIGAIVVIALGSGDDEPTSNETAGGTADYGDLGYRPTDTGKRPVGSNDPLAGSGSGAVGSGKPIDRGNGSGTGRRPQGGSQAGTGSGTGSGSVAAGSGSGSDTANPGLPELSADDVFAMSSRMESGTRRCYERAMKDDPFLKVSKIKATISVSAAGPVSNVTLSSMANTPLGNCLVAAIKRWPFKPSKDGIVSEFALVFERSN